MPTHWRPSCRAATSAEPEPAKGSSKVPCGGQKASINGLRAATGLSPKWGSGCEGRCEVPVVGDLETLAEAGAERAVVEGAADLEQPIGPAPGPAHLLRLAMRRLTRKLAVPSVSA